MTPHLSSVTADALRSAVRRALTELTPARRRHAPDSLGGTAVLAEDSADVCMTRMLEAIKALLDGAEEENGFEWWGS
jgi:hypothetical protein